MRMWQKGETFEWVMGFVIFGFACVLVAVSFSEKKEGKKWREKCCVEPGITVSPGEEIVVKKSKKHAVIISSKIDTTLKENKRFNCRGCRKHIQCRVRLSDTSVLTLFYGMEIEKVDQPSHAKSESVATEKFLVDYEE